MSGILTILMFFIVIILTAVVFCGWVVFMIGRTIAGGITSLFPVCPRRREQARISNTVQCPTRMCGAINPSSARFCRRCGRGLPGAQRVQVRRAAVW
jgi:ribosomal protein L40E